MARKKADKSELEDRKWLRPAEVRQLYGVGASKLWWWITQKYFNVTRPDPDPKSRIVLVEKISFENFYYRGTTI